jgi:hypothetical protein
MNEPALIISVIAAVFSGMSLTLAGLAWYESHQARKKANDANRIASGALVYLKEKDERKILRKLKKRCIIVRSNLEKLKRVYDSIQIAAVGRVKDSSIKKKHNQIDNRSALIDAISTRLETGISGNDGGAQGLEQKLIGIERYEAAQREYANNLLKRVLSRKQKRQDSEISRVHWRPSFVNSA